jgi:iron complex outermembrane receptor protein
MFPGNAAAAEETEGDDPRAPLDGGLDTQDAVDAAKPQTVRDRANSQLPISQALVPATVPATPPFEITPADPDSNLGSLAPGERDIPDLNLEALLQMTVVTASGEEEQRSTAAANVFTMTSAEIRARGYDSLQEILHAVPGLYVVDDHVFSSLGVRGVTGGFRGGTRIVKVMIDGQAVNFRPELMAFWGPEYIPIEAIERVEVAKGPLSALYGADAFLATVNVITKKPGSAEDQVRLRAGSHQQNLSTSLSMLGSAGDSSHGILVAATLAQIDRSGLRLDRTFPGQTLLAQLPFDQASARDMAQPVGAFIRANYDLPASQGSFVLEGGFQRFDHNAEFQLNSVLTHRTRIALDNTWGKLEFSKRAWQNKLKLRSAIGFGYGRPTRDSMFYLTENTFHYFKPNYRYRSVTLLAEGFLVPFSRLSFKLGVDGELAQERVLYHTQVFNRQEGGHAPLYEIELLRTGQNREQDANNLGGYLQSETQPIPQISNLRLTANFRVDRRKFGPASYPTQYSWRAALAYPWSVGYVSKIIGGRAFQSPSGVLLFSQGDVGNMNNIIGSAVFPDWPTLRPQTINSVEVWQSAKLCNSLLLEASVSYQALNDAIEFVQTGPYFVATNRGQRRALAGEIATRFQLRPVYAYLDISLYHPFNQKDPAPLETVSSAAPELYPNWSSLLGIDIELWQNLSVRTEGRWVGARGSSQSNAYYNNLHRYNLPSYSLWDVMLVARDLTWLEKTSLLTVMLSVRNLTNRKYYEPGFGGIDVPQMGRTFIIEIRQSM